MRELPLGLLVLSGALRFSSFHLHVAMQVHLNKTDLGIIAIFTVTVCDPSSEIVVVDGAPGC